MSSLSAGLYAQSESSPQSVEPTTDTTQHGEDTTSTTTTAVDTTQHGEDTTSTTTSTTTTTPAATELPSEYTKGHWIVEHNGTYCLRMEMELQFVVEYTNSTNDVSGLAFAVFSSLGSCPHLTNKLRHF